MMYNPKEKITCQLCNKEYENNSNGHFTSHLRYDHQLNLDSYLLEYFYKKEDLLCTKCSNNVLLNSRRKPSKYCDDCLLKTNLQKKYKNKNCEYCKNEFITKDIRVKTCSKECSELLRVSKITDWHSNMEDGYKKNHFNKIIEKTAATRRKNGTPSWNSGKTGIYSEETIEKIRLGAIKTLRKREKSSLEKLMIHLLEDLSIKYEYFFELENRQYDFILPEYNILIETDGDYWHGNPRLISEENLKPWQLERKEVDKLKTKIAIDNGYRIVRFWEYDVINHPYDVKNTLLNMIHS